MISFVEPYLSPLKETADSCQSFQKRKRILSEDQTDALEFLFELNPKQRHVPVKMGSSSGKTKMILCYYEWLKSRGEKVMVISYNKKEKYHLYATQLGIVGYDKFNFIGKRMTSRNATVFILDQSSFCKSTLRNNQDRVSLLLSNGDNVRVVEIQSDWNNLVSENKFMRKSILSNRCNTKLKPYSLESGSYFGETDTTVSEICNKLLDKWFVDGDGELAIITTQSELDKELTVRCEKQGYSYVDWTAEGTTCIVEKATRLIVICDIPVNTSQTSIYAIASKLRYIFYRFSNAFRDGRSVSAAVIVPNETSKEMAICMSFLLSSEQVNTLETSSHTCKIKGNYTGFRPKADLSLQNIFERIYSLRIDGEWSTDKVELNSSSFFELNEGNVSVQSVEVLSDYVSLTSADLFCEEELSWNNSSQVLFM